MTRVHVQWARVYVMGWPSDPFRGELSNPGFFQTPGSFQKAEYNRKIARVWSLLLVRREEHYPGTNATN